MYIDSNSERCASMAFITGYVPPRSFFLSIVHDDMTILQLPVFLCSRMDCCATCIAKPHMHGQLMSSNTKYMAYLNNCMHVNCW